MPGTRVRETESRSTETQTLLPGRSAWLFQVFRRYARRYMARHFHAVRLSRSGPLPAIPDGPLIVVLNHPSWWDPMIGLVLSERLPDRDHFAPIDAKTLSRYRFMERLGFFGIEPGTARGGLTFIRTARRILARPSATLWITAQGRFTDPRERPLTIMPGVGHLSSRLDGGSILPLALEYPFWDERDPEALARFGALIPIGPGPSADEWNDRIVRGLESAQDRLAIEAQARDPEAFEVLIAGRAGVGGVYDLGRRLRAMLRGERFRPEHGSSARKP